MASFVLGHFMHGVMDGVIAQLLGALSQSQLAGGGAALRRDADGKVFLGGGGNNFAQQLGKLCCVLRLFKGDALVSFSNLGEAFAIRLTAHRQVHTDLGALAGEVLAQTLDDFGIQTLGNADAMLVRPLDLVFFQQIELGRRCVAVRAELRSLIARMNVTANRTYPLHFHYLRNVYSFSFGGAFLLPSALMIYR